MKQTYKKPLTEVSIIDTELFLCISGTISTTLINDDAEIITSEQQVLSKEASSDLWDDED